MTLPNPVMTASGTAGHGAELAAYLDLAALGAVVVKSLSAEPWPGNPAPRVHETRLGMLNSVGLQGPGVAAWLADDLPRAGGRRGPGGGQHLGPPGGGRSPQAAAAAAPASTAAWWPWRSTSAAPTSRTAGGCSPTRPAATAEAVARRGGPSTALPLWAKLSPNVTDLAEIAGAAAGRRGRGGTLVNTLLGMAIDVERRRPVLGAGGGGLSGAGHPPGGRAGRLRRAGGIARRPHRRRGGRDDRAWTPSSC